MSPEGHGGSSPALELRGVSKRFGDVAALTDASLSVAVGSVHAVLGENGAGKSTLMRIAYGLMQPDAGDVRLFGAAVQTHSVRRAILAGVGMVHQQLSLAPNLSVLENLVLGDRGVYRPAVAEALLRRTADIAGLRVPTAVLARDLSIVDQQRLEIIKALARGARLLILDEPTAVLAPAEIKELLRWIREFASGGGSVVLVTHKLREALAVADHVTVLRRGRAVHTGEAAGRPEREVARIIFPDAVDEVAAFAAATPGDVVVDATAVDVIGARGERRVHDATFEVRRHEIVGIAAVEGSGHRELLAALAGLQRVSAGTLRLPARVATIPADRGRDALIAEFTLTENIALRGAGTRRGSMPWRAIAKGTETLLGQFNVVATGANARADSLSGGNQQRLVVARELEGEVDLVVADNPTRGLDTRATAFVLDQLRGAATRGAAVVTHSSDLDEMLAVATRVLVVFQGTVRSVKLDRDEIGRAMLGAT